MKRVILIVLAVAALAALVPGASKAEPNSGQASTLRAQGEAKNELPFTRRIVARAANHGFVARARSLAVNEVGHGMSIQAPAGLDTGSGSAARQGYTTLGPPQAGQVGSLNYAGGQGEAKNQAPFTNAVVTTSNRSGSDWIELTLGGIAIVLVGGVVFGVVQLTRHAAAKPVA